MLSLEEIKRFIKDPTLSDEEVKIIRDDLWGLAEIIFGQLKQKRRLEKINNKSINIT